METKTFFFSFFFNAWWKETNILSLRYVLCNFSLIEMRCQGYLYDLFHCKCCVHETACVWCCRLNLGGFQCTVGAFAVTIRRSKFPRCTVTVNKNMLFLIRQMCISFDGKSICYYFAISQGFLLPFTI